MKRPSEWRLWRVDDELLMTILSPEIVRCLALGQELNFMTDHVDILALKQRIDEKLNLCAYSEDYMDCMQCMRAIASTSFATLSLSLIHI